MTSQRLHKVRFPAELLLQPPDLSLLKQHDPTAKIEITADLTEQVFQELTGQDIRGYLSGATEDPDGREVPITVKDVLEQFTFQSMQMRCTQALLRRTDPDAALDRAKISAQLLPQDRLSIETIEFLIHLVEQWPDESTADNRDLLVEMDETEITLTDMYDPAENLPAQAPS